MSNTRIATIPSGTKIKVRSVLAEAPQPVTIDEVTVRMTKVIARMHALRASDI